MTGQQSYTLTCQNLNYLAPGLAKTDGSSSNYLDVTCEFIIMVSAIVSDSVKSVGIVITLCDHCFMIQP